MRDAVKLSVKGSSTFLVNACKNNAIPLLGVECNDNSTVIIVKRKDLSKCEKLLLSTNRDYKVLGRLGAVFLAKTLVKRVGIWLALAVIIMLGSIYSQYLFSVEITSSDLSFLDGANVALEGVSFPTKKSEVDLDAIAKRAYSIEGVSYATATIEGNRLRLRLVGEAKPNAVIDLASPTNLVATRDAIVTRVVAYQGTPMVEVGDVVAKGSVLISGKLAITEDLAIDVNATGEVYGLVYHQEKLYYPTTTVTMRRTGEVKTHYAVNFLQHTDSYTPPYDSYEVERKELFSLPLINFAITKLSYYRTQQASVALDWQSNSDDIIEQAYEASLARLPQDAIVRKKSHEVKKLDNYYILELYYQTEEKIYESKNY